MKSLISIIVVFFLSYSFLEGQNEYSYFKGDTLYVWAKSGLNLRSQPDIHSAVLFTVPYGHGVKIIECGIKIDVPYSVKVIDTVRIGAEIFPDYTIQGYWAEVEYSGKKGFVFDGFLSNFPGFKNVDKELYLSLNIDEYGILKVLEKRESNNLVSHFRP